MLRFSFDDLILEPEQGGWGFVVCLVIVVLFGRKLSSRHCGSHDRYGAG